MVQDGRKKILLIIAVLLMISSVIAVVLSFILNNSGSGSSNTPGGNVNPGGTTNPGQPSKPSQEINYEITRLEDEELYFSIQNLLNDYYSDIASLNGSKLLKILDTDYVMENEITTSNIDSKLNNNYEAVTFIAKDIYYNANSQTTYYFVNGYLYNSSMMEDYYSYEKDVSYLVIVDKNREYTIKPLGENKDIYNFANNYNLVNVDFENGIKYQKADISEKNKLVIYINEFLKLLFYDTERAYNMLGNETKAKYLNYADFQNQINNIYNNVSTNIFGHSKIEKDGYNEYDIKDDKQKNIQIIEKGIMDYQINY